MSQRLPTDDQVRQAMRQVLLDAADTGRRATITSVERALGLAHPTFYRNYPHLIAWFRTETASTPDGAGRDKHTAAAATGHGDPGLAEMIGNQVASELIQQGARDLIDADRQEPSGRTGR